MAGAALIALCRREDGGACASGDCPPGHRLIGFVILCNGWLLGMTSMKPRASFTLAPTCSPLLETARQIAGCSYPKRKTYSGRIGSAKPIAAAGSSGPLIPRRRTRRTRHVGLGGTAYSFCLRNVLPVQRGHQRCDPPHAILIVRSSR